MTAKSDLKIHTNKLIKAREAFRDAQFKADSIEASIESSKLKVESLREEFASYRKSLRESRLASIHEHTFPSMNIGENGTVKEVTINEIKEGEFHYQSKNGRSHFFVSAMPPELRRYLMLDEESSDIKQYPEIVSASIIQQKRFIKPLVSNLESTKRESNTKNYPNSADEHRKKMDHLIDRRSELEVSRQILNLKIRTLSERQSQHKKNIRDTGSYQSKNALRSIDKLRTDARDRLSQIKTKLIILNSLIEKART